MWTEMANLTDSKLRAIKPDDKPLSDGMITGLRLHPHGRVKGQGQWKLRYVSPETGKRRDMGLGSYPSVGLSDARAKAVDARSLLASGDDPIEARVRLHIKSEVAAAVVILTFEEAARRRYAELLSGFKNAKHKQQWIRTLETYVFPKLGDRLLVDLKVADFADALRPIWLEKVETAQRVKQRCHEVMDWAFSQDMIQGNPVAVVNKLLSKQPAKSQRVQHHPALPWCHMPEFYANNLADIRSTTKALLLFVILTAVRSGEARYAQWDQIDLQAKIWTVPADRMKTGRLHRVPLSDAAVILLEQQARSAKGSLVFPAPRGGVLTDMALTAFLRKNKIPSDVAGRVATAHGFRSTFRDWASEAGYARDLAERALAHVIKNQSEAAYHRTDLLDQRRPMMEKWADYVTSVNNS